MMRKVWANTGNIPKGLASADGYIYVANSGDNTIGKISLLDPSDNIQNWAETGKSPMGLAIYGGYLYVANYDDDTIGKINLADPTNDNDQNWAVDVNHPMTLVIFHGWLFVSGDMVDNVEQISSNNSSDRRNHPLGKIYPNPCLVSYKDYIFLFGQPITVSTLNDYAYMVNPDTKTITLADKLYNYKNIIWNWQSTGNNASNILIDNLNIYVTNSDDNTISIYDLYLEKWNPNPIQMRSLFTDNSKVYYKPGSMAACGVGTVKNSRFRSKKI